LDDQQLKLLFACAHPDLSPKVQVVITLKYVLNLKVDAIAAVLGMSIDGIDKMLLRSRQKIREQNIIFSLPAISSLKSRLPIVHKIIYLIFNEGYKSVSGKELVREELCEEALLMNKEILDKRLGDPSTAALQALMLFNAARLKARFGPNGDLRDLEEQDRSLWNKELIFLGTTFFKQSRTTILSTYHFEASIAYLHCNGKDFHSTDWMSISRLYNHLVAINPNPFVELNAAIALYYAGNCKEALARLYELAENSLMQKYYLLNATLGKIHYLEGNHTKAREYFLRTIEQTKIQSEKDFIMKMLAKLEQDR
jgi:RNA polymerase sigma-70 factor (ECF subfamily)